MTNDNYHLYTKIGTGTTLNDYAEFRIVNVGAHQANGESDYSALTFQATHAMPNAYAMNTDGTTESGWARCELRTKINTDGFEGLKTGLTNDIMTVVKKIELVVKAMIKIQ